MFRGAENNNNSVVSWTGNTNESWQHIQTQIYSSENISFELWKRTSEMIKYHTLLPFGSCAEIMNYSSTIYIGSTQPLQVYFTDPYQQSYYRIEKDAMPDDPVSLQGGKDGVYDNYSFKINLVLEKKLESKTFCRMYENPTDYADCVYISMRDKFLAMLGKFHSVISLGNIR